jgi:2-dehydro-3-deoxygalactonokinase
MRFIAIDWGTTNCRAYALDGGTHSIPDGGILSLSRDDYPPILQHIRESLGDPQAHLPILISGMAGSNRGWIEAPYVPCPASVAQIAAAAIAVPGQRNVFIASGVRSAPDQAADVMRGEETQIFGHAQATGFFCLPGTHTKWAVQRDGRIIEFATTMSGEMFHLLREHSILKTSMPAQDAQDQDAFLAGVAASKNGTFLRSVFSVRARSLLDGLGADHAFSYLSGLVIGEDVREGFALFAERDPILIGAEPLCVLYGRAITAYGGRSTKARDDAVLRGAEIILRHLQQQGRVI